MRGARLLQMLLLLQNRGRMTSAELAGELEVSRRTVLRDLDAMTEAGLPVIVYPGQGGGIELGFDYRSRMTALTSDEAEALGIMLATPHPGLEALGLGQAARRAAGKIVENQSAPIREGIARATAEFRLEGPRPDPDPRPEALARAVRGRRIVLLQSRSATQRRIHPARLTFDGADWIVTEADGTDHPRASWGDLQISAKSYEVEGSAPVST